ncbi:MAG: hypothetical protein PHT15_06965 [Gallionellaceae bacterium]|nr:hypothetical protein [Gallionellaceae bacterium]
MTNTLKNFTRKIREINQRYSKPHIEMSPGVKIALLSLRVYLLFLVSLMVYKFITLLS